MLTKQDKKYLNKTFATKKDLEKFATKKDLGKFATKEQLTQQALDIGTEFERVRDEFAVRAVEVDEKFKKIDIRFDKMDDRFDKMENLMKSLIEEVLVEVRGANERVDKIESHLGLAIA